jgi:hypothetical protein
MWKVKTLEIQNPAGLLVDSHLDWSGETYLFGPQREILFIALSQFVLRPKVVVSLGFNPRAQMFRSLQNIFSLAEKILNLNANCASDSMIGAIVSGELERPKNELQTSSIQKMLRAEVTLFLASVSVDSSHLSEDELLRIFEYLASVNSQTDEMLPIVLEQILGRKVRSIFELLTSDIFFYRASGLKEMRQKLYEAERTLSVYIVNMRLPDWKSEQIAPAHLSLKTPSNAPKAVFIPFSSSGTDSKTSESVEEICLYLRGRGVDSFYIVESFVERLRWIERIAVRRQLDRLNSVRADPLRAQAFFDARAGRNGFIVLSDKGHAILQKAIADFGLVNFEMDVQEMVATSLEIYELRNSVSIFKDPWYDLVVLAQALTDVDPERSYALRLDDTDVIRRLLQQGEFP